MHQSFVIEISGRFAGAALAQEGGFRFVAVDPSVRGLDGRVWATLPDMRRTVHSTFAKLAPHTPAPHATP